MAAAAHKRNGHATQPKKSETQVHSPLVAYGSMLGLLLSCPPFVIILWYTMVHMDGSVLKTWNFLKQQGIQGLISIWPAPSLLACKMIAVYAAFEAALQLLLPGKEVYGPISPMGNRPVYKENGVAAYVCTLVVYLSIWRFGLFNPSLVYDHLGEIFSSLIFGSIIFCILLYIKLLTFDRANCLATSSITLSFRVTIVILFSRSYYTFINKFWILW